MTDPRPLDAERIFAVLDAHKVEHVVIGGIAASRDDLIKMKRAAGRPLDLADIAALTEAEQQSVKPTDSSFPAS
jgi:hypothetical protein